MEGLDAPVTKNLFGRFREKLDPDETSGTYDFWVGGISTWVELLGEILGPVPAGMIRAGSVLPSPRGRWCAVSTPPPTPPVAGTVSGGTPGLFPTPPCIMPDHDPMPHGRRGVSGVGGREGVYYPSDRFGFFLKAESSAAPLGFQIPEVECK